VVLCEFYKNLTRWKKCDPNAPTFRSCWGKLETVLDGSLTANHEGKRYFFDAAVEMYH